MGYRLLLVIIVVIVNLIENDKNGWIIENANPKKFAKKDEISSRRMSDLRSQLGANGRKMMLQTYSIQKVLEEKSSTIQLFMEEVEGAKWATH